MKQPQPLYFSDCGALLDDIEPFTKELIVTVDTMKEAMVNEKKILEGTAVPEYGKAEWEIPKIDRADVNELSETKQEEKQWTPPSLNGCSTVDPALTSTIELNNSSSSVVICTQNCLTIPCTNSCCVTSMPPCKGTSDVCGCATEPSSAS
jgi:hypothetical protein